MEAIVLAGGLGSRLRHIVPGLPKPMALVGGCPFLQILLTSIAKKGISRVVLSLGYKSEMVVNHFGTSFAGMRIVYSIEDTPLGTGGALRKAFNMCEEDHNYVFNGDTFLDLEIGEVEQNWLTHESPILIAREVLDTTRYGRIVTEGGRVVRFSEKSTSGPGLINAGCYVFPSDILDKFKSREHFSLEEDFLSVAVRKYRFEIYISKGYFIDIGEPEDFARAQIELAGWCD